MLARTLIAAAMLAAAGAAPASAAVFYQATVTSEGGIAAFRGSPFTDPRYFATGSIWVGVDTGQLLGGLWMVDATEARLWWDRYYDANGEPFDYLDGNEYFYSPACTVDAAAPDCRSGALHVRLGPNTLRADFVQPQGFNRCYPFNGVYLVDCAVSYAFSFAIADLDAAAPDGTPVTFSFYDSGPPEAVPEPATWALLLTGFAFTGTALRRRGRARRATGSSTRNPLPMPGL